MYNLQNKQCGLTKIKTSPYFLFINLMNFYVKGREQKLLFKSYIIQPKSLIIFTIKKIVKINEGVLNHLCNLFIYNSN